MSLHLKRRRPKITSLRCLVRDDKLYDNGKRRKPKVVEIVARHVKARAIERTMVPL